MISVGVEVGHRLHEAFLALVGRKNIYRPRRRAVLLPSLHPGYDRCPEHARIIAHHWHDLSRGPELPNRELGGRRPHRAAQAFIISATNDAKPRAWFE